LRVVRSKVSGNHERGKEHVLVLITNIYQWGSKGGLSQFFDLNREAGEVQTMESQPSGLENLQDLKLSCTAIWNFKHCYKEQNVSVHLFHRKNNGRERKECLVW
jgi:hypothetical protein